MRGISLVTLLCIFLLLPGTSGMAGPTVQFQGKIEVDLPLKVLGNPKAFCVTQDELFLFIDENTKKIQVLGKNKNALEFIRDFGTRKVDSFDVPFQDPMACFYNSKSNIFGVIDNRKNGKAVLFKQTGVVDFMFLKEIPCESGGYDAEFNDYVDQIIISGYLADDEGNPYDLYGINNSSGEIEYLMPSYIKYGLNNPKEYKYKYNEEQSLPAIGIKAYTAILDDDLFFVWEGDLRVLKFNLHTKEVTDTFGKKTKNYIQPDGVKLASSFRNREFKKTWALQKTMSYVTNIFASSRHVFVIYEKTKDSSDFILQSYDIEGNYLGETPITPQPQRYIWFDESSYELYAFAKKSDKGNGKLNLLRYKIGR